MNKQRKKRQTKTDSKIRNKLVVARGEVGRRVGEIKGKKGGKIYIMETVTKQS